MPQPENLGTFFTENKTLLKEYIETRLSLLKLQSLNTLSKSGGMIIWTMVAILFTFVIIVFAGLVLGFWFSSLTGSHIKGFGLATLVYIALFALVALFRKTLFVKPMVRKIINKANNN
jgi:hypothetical protein